MKNPNSENDARKRELVEAKNAEISYSSSIVKQYEESFLYSKDTGNDGMEWTHESTVISNVTLGDETDKTNQLEKHLQNTHLKLVGTGDRRLFEAVTGVANPPIE